MLKSIWEKIKSIPSYLKQGWFWFEAQVAKVAPGLKTLVINGLVAVGSASTLLVTYLQQVPMDKFVDGTTLAIIMLVASTLSFWLKDIGNRVEARQDGNN